MTPNDLTQTETRVVEAFFRSIPPTQCLGVMWSQGEYVLTIQHRGHRQQVRDRSLITALAQALRVHEALSVESTTTQEAA